MDFLKDFFKNNGNNTPYFSEDSQHFNEEQDSNQRFDLFSDHIKMQQSFEHHINEILKSFQFDGFSTIFSTSPDFHIDEQQSQSLRDHFLKDGYQKLHKKGEVKTDQDLDEKVRYGNLGSLLEDNSIHDDQLRERKSQGNFFSSHGNFFSSHSKSFQLTTLPDGTIQTENFVQDNEGNEEKTVCYKQGNKEYCVIQRKNKNGKEDVTEKFINISEAEKSDFIRTYRNLTTNGPPSGFPFNFFS